MGIKRKKEMKKLRLLVEDIESSHEYKETTKIIQKLYDETGFIPNIYDCISPSLKEGNIEDNDQVMREPNEIDLWVVERWLHREGDALHIWVTTQMIRPVILSKDGNQIKF